MSYLDDLNKLGDLHQRGVLTDEEFARAKTRIFNGEPAGGPRPAQFDNALHSFRRSRNDRWLGGVCGGLGQLTEVPSWLWRLVFVALLCCGGTGVLLYILLWIFVPSETSQPRNNPAFYSQL